MIRDPNDGTCRICANSTGNRAFFCSEKMFGLGGKFLYFQCRDCGCLQISKGPSNSGSFYPANYYSYRLSPLPRSGWKARVAAWRDFSVATNSGIPGRLISRLLPAPTDVSALAHVPLRQTMKILDVGCGGGALLSYLQRAGFESLAGIDPFLPAEVQISPTVFVRKLGLEQVSEQFDLVMLHHVFEHVESGRQMLENCRQRLTPQGKILLRFPTVESDAWEIYRENWVQLDAPRHFFLHSKSSFALLARQAGLKIEKWLGDSTAFQFWGSELYRRGLPLFDAQGVPTSLEKHFTARELKAFAMKSNIANHAGRGDQVIVVLSVEAGG